MANPIFARTRLGETNSQGSTQVTSPFTVNQFGQQGTENGGIIDDHMTGPGLVGGLGYTGGDYGSPFDWGSLFGSMPSFGGFSGGHVSAGHVTAGHANATHGEASLIDTNDPIYSLFAPKPWMSGMLSKGKEYIGAATEDNIRLMRDNATRSGVNTSSPAYLYMVSMQRREQQKALANALRDANLAWTLPAADRRHGALGQNAQNLTNVSMGNAEMDTNVSIANAGYATQASAANAGNQLAASQANASNSLQGQMASAQMAQSGWMFQTNFIKDIWQFQTQMASNILNQPGSGAYSPAEPNYFSGGVNGALQGGQAGLSLFQLFQNASNPNTNQGLVRK